MNQKQAPLKLGLSACFFHADPLRAIFKGKTLQYLEQSLANWLMHAGNQVFLIPALPEGTPLALADIVSEFDGLVLQGGSDVAPGTYGEKPIRPEWSGDAIRDRYEIALLQEFRRQGKPVLGICRGAQLMNVAFGGTLYQDIELQVPKALNHRNWEIYDQNFHEIRFELGSGLHQLYGAGTYRINTIHHQGIKDLGQGLRVEAVSPQDGVIEAIRHTGETYALAVQWHPEFHSRENDSRQDSTLLDDRVFLHEFMEACRKARTTGKHAK